MLCTILELLRSLPDGEVRSAWGEGELDDVWKYKLLEKLCALRLEDANAGGDGVGEETAIGAVLKCARWNFGCLEAIDRFVVGCAADEAKRLLRADWTEENQGTEGIFVV